MTGDFRKKCKFQGKTLKLYAKYTKRNQKDRYYAVEMK